MNSVTATIAFVYAIMVACFIIGVNSALNLVIRNDRLTNKQIALYSLSTGVFLIASIILLSVGHSMAT